MTSTLSRTLSIGLAAVEDGEVVFEIRHHSVSTQGTLDSSKISHRFEPVLSVAVDSENAVSQSINQAIKEAEDGLKTALAN